MSNDLVFKLKTDKIVLPHLDCADEEEGVSPQELVKFVYENKVYDVFYKKALEGVQNPEIESDKERQDMMAFMSMMYALLRESEFKRVHKSLGSTDPHFSVYEKQILGLMMCFFKDRPENMMGYYNQFGIFPGLLYKEGPHVRDSLNDFNNVIKKNPKWCLEVAVESLLQADCFDEHLPQKVDMWLAKQLSDMNLKKAAQDKEFVCNLMRYFQKSSPDENAVCRLIFQKIDAFDDEGKMLVLSSAFNKSKVNERSVAAVESYLSNDHSAETNEMFYFISQAFMSEKMGRILGRISERTQRKYLNLVKQQHGDITQLRSENSQTGASEFLLWNLHNKGKLSDQEVIQAIQNYPLKDRFEPARQDFFFHNKKSWNRDIFKTGCQKVKNSTLHSLMWLNSFSKLPRFNSCLASLWAELPVQMRQNKNIQLACDNHFDLFYQLSQNGDTSMLNEIKQNMKDNYPEFIRRLTRLHESGNTCLHMLCHQEKKGVLKLLERLPQKQQDELLNQKNDMGKSPLDVCSDDFRRFLIQKNFVRPVCEENKTDAVVPNKVVQKPAVSQIHSSKKDLILRQLFKVKRFEDDLERFQNQPNVIESLERELKQLRTMPLTGLLSRTRRDVVRDSKSRICVADFAADGNAYRMGYIFQNGLIAPLFVMTCQQYSKIKGSFDTMCKNVRKQINAQTVPQKQGDRR